MTVVPAQQSGGGGGPVLPMRSGSVAPDDAAVVGVLAERAGHYEERLEALDGKVEYNVKASHEEEAVLHCVMSEMDIDWWESDPYLSSGARSNELARENAELRAHVVELERGLERRPSRKRERTREREPTRKRQPTRKRRPPEEEAPG